jgi:hypothetical protein
MSIAIANDISKRIVDFLPFFMETQSGLSGKEKIQM